MAGTRSAFCRPAAFGGLSVVSGPGSGVLAKAAASVVRVCHGAVPAPEEEFHHPGSVASEGSRTHPDGTTPSAGIRVMTGTVTSASEAPPW